jgi:hypothetical protein
VVINEFNVESVIPFEAEDDPPVGPYSDGPESFQVALERV